MGKSKKTYRINIKKPVYAIMLSDTPEGVEYGEVKSLGEAMNVGLTPIVAAGTLYGNGAIVDSTEILTGLTLAVGITQIPIEDRAAIYNQEISNGVMVTKAGVEPNSIALGYMVQKTGGKREYVWLLKGKPKQMARNDQQSESNINYSTDNMEIVFSPREFDENLKFEADTSYDEFTEEQAEAWFVNAPVSIPQKRA